MGKSVAGLSELESFLMIWLKKKQIQQLSWKMKISLFWLALLQKKTTV